MDSFSIAKQTEVPNNMGRLGRSNRPFRWGAGGAIHLLLGLLLLVPGWAAAADAVSLVKATTQEIQAAMQREGLVIDSDPRRLNQLIDKIVVPHFDFRRMSRRVLGKHWKRASAGQKERFALEFKQLLIRTYAAALSENRDQPVNYLPIRAVDDKRVVVRTAVARTTGAPITINYEMYSLDSTWKVYDVSVEGVSLVINYRASFAAEINKSGLDALIRRLASRNAKG